MMKVVDANYLPGIFNILPSPSLVLRPDSPRFIIVDANEAYLSVVNISREKLVGRDFFDVFPDHPYFRNPGSENLFEKLLRENLPNKTPVLEYEVAIRDGSDAAMKYFVATNTPVFNDRGETDLILRTLTDVTEVIEMQKSERKANESLAKNERFLDETQHIARIGSWEVDLVNNTIIWSDVVKEIHEVESDFQPTFESGLSFHSNLESREKFVELVTDAIERAGDFDVETEILTAKGNLRWVRMTGKAEHSEGKGRRLYGATQDITQKRITEQSLIDSRNHFQSLVQSINGIVWEANFETFEFFFVSDQVKDILGFTPEEWLSEPDFWRNHIHPADRVEAVDYCKLQVREFKNHTFDYRMIKADGNVIWIKDVVSVIKENGKPVCLRGLMVDITETKRNEELVRLEKSVLEMNFANDTAVIEVLSEYMLGIEKIFPNMHCSIHKIKDRRLLHWVAPTLPQPYLEAIDNVLIGQNTGSCGTAAFTKERVIVADIANDIRWADYRDIALKNNLLACWSQPVINDEGLVIATFGIYYGEVKLPDEAELKVIDRCAAILKIILENRRKSELLEETSSLMKQGQELAHFGNWQWDIPANVVTWSEELYAIYGLDKRSFKATFEGYQELLHPDDREQVVAVIMNVLYTKEDIVFEERIVRPTGEIRHLKSWGRLKTDEKGTPVKMIGACLDITRSKKIREQLRASESRLRSIVDAQTNYVMRIDLNGHYTYYNNKYKEDFGWIFKNKALFGESPMDTVVPEHHQRVRDVTWNSISHPNQIFQVEIDKLSLAGGVRSTFWHFICLPDSKGEPKEVQCIGIDITDRKQAEDALKVSNERYEYVNKATNDAIYDWDALSDHIHWGEGFKRLFGFDSHQEKYPLSDWLSHISEADLPKIEQSLSKAMHDKLQSNWRGEYQFRKANGDYAYVEENAYILRDKQGKVSRMIGVLRDITHQKREEHRLKLLESVIIHANDSVLIAEADPANKTNLHIVYANEAFRKMTGYSLREVIGKNTVLFNGPDSDLSDIDEIVSAIKAGQFIQLETIQYKKNGEQFWISLSLNPIENEKGEISHWVSIGHNITERMQYIGAIETQNEKLQNIAWIQSHVVRAPLARLMGLVNLIKNYDNSDSERNQLMDHFLTSANELDDVIRDISENAKLTSGV